MQNEQNMLFTSVTTCVYRSIVLACDKPYTHTNDSSVTHILRLIALTAPLVTVGFLKANNRGVQSSKIDEVLVRVAGRDNVTRLLCASACVPLRIDRNIAQIDIP
jgi:hypothetical protein